MSWKIEIDSEKRPDHMVWIDGNYQMHENTCTGCRGKCTEDNCPVRAKEGSDGDE